MGNTRKLVLAVAVAAATTVGAAPAAATESVSVVDEQTATVCSNLSEPGAPDNHLTGGCSVHAVGNFIVRIDLGIWGEMHHADCQAEFDLRIGGDGATAIDDIAFYPGDGRCYFGGDAAGTECDTPWEGVGEETGDHTVGVTSDLCFHVGGGDLICEGNIDYSIVEAESTEEVSFSFENTSIFACEIEAELMMEETPEEGTTVHINHQ